MANLTDDQAAVYDRQLRVWGVEVQNRLSSAKALIAGGNGLAAEVAKNIVLAGVGHVAIADDTACSNAASGNFLVSADAQPQSSVAAASAHTLQAMNPFIHVAAQPGNVHTLTPDTLQQYDLVFATGLSFTEASQLDKQCTQLGKQLFIAEVRGPNSWTFINLQHHEYAQKVDAKQKDQAAGSVLEYCSLQQAMSTPMSKLGRKTHPMYAAVRAAYHFEEAQGRPAGPDDLAQVKGLLEVQGGRPSSTHEQLLESFLLDREELAPVSAVVGGVVANNIIRAISHVNPPLQNLFFFGLFDCMGVVENMQ